MRSKAKQRVARNKLSVVSLFSGAGGLDLGFIQAGHEVVWAVDNDIDSAGTYEKNIGNHIICENIEKIRSAEIPTADVIIAGLPCQGFSVANKFRSGGDGRNNLYQEMLRIIRDKQPKWFVAENVRGILNLDNGNFFIKIVDAFKSAGYQISHRIVNMADYGVPQTRIRVIIIGTRNDIAHIRVDFPAQTHSKDGKNHIKWKSISEALRELRDLRPTLNLDGSRYGVSYRDYSGHRKTDGSKPSPTITARGDGGGGVNAVPHPNGKRRLNVRESAWMQTFPCDFEFVGSTNSAYRQIGNAVPVKYSYLLAKQFKTALKRDAIKAKSGNKIGLQPKVVSLFSGAGGMDLGFKQAGFDIVWANDNFKDATETYKKNLGNIIPSDIKDIKVKEIPDADIVIGGFPCQGFSIANMNRHLDDSRNLMYRKFVEIVNKKQPQYFLAENVKGILNLAKGAIFRCILNDFTNAGYNCSYALLNAADYGVPQIRERVFILGIRSDLNPLIDFPPRPTHANRHISVGEALENIPEPDEEHILKNHEYSRFKLKFNGYICHRFTDPKKPSPTFTARGDGKGGAMVMHHPSNKRRLSCREAACIQGFPLDYEFCGTMTSVYRQIGNAVPPPLARAVAERIYKHIMTNRKGLGTQSEKNRGATSGKDSQQLSLEFH
ncbi:MAG: DNA cytosine methyltransferase [Candidatus Aminicenantales bacterium]